MKNTFNVLLCLLVSSTIFAQIDWNSYKEPDGTFKRFIIDPNFNYSSNDGESTTTARLDLDYLGNAVKEKSIFSYSLSNNFRVQDEFTNHSFQANTGYRHYFTKRRGLSIEIDPSFSINNAKSKDWVDGWETNTSYSIPLKLGIGRLENVSTLYQAARLDNQLTNIEPMGNEDLFALADLLRTLDYNTLLDTRMRNIDNTVSFLNELESLGYSLDTKYDMVNAIDAFRFERPNTISNGYYAAIGAQYRNGNFFDSQKEITLEAEYHKAINDKFHFLIGASGFINMEALDQESINFRSQVSYMPSARTFINLSVDYQRFESLNFNAVPVKTFEKSRIGLNANYFVSPQLSVFGSINWQDNFLAEHSSFNSGFGFRYFVF